jgi:hypothetical protein
MTLLEFLDAHFVGICFVTIILSVPAVLIMAFIADIFTHHSYYKYIGSQVRKPSKVARKDKL